MKHLPILVLGVSLLASAFSLIVLERDMAHAILFFTALFWAGALCVIRWLAYD